MNPKVQEFAGRLASDVYGKFMRSDTDADEPGDDEDGEPQVSLEEVAERLEQLPTREELISSFSFLQAELVRQNQKTRLFVVCGLGLQLMILLAALYWII